MPLISTDAPLSAVCLRIGDQYFVDSIWLTCFRDNPNVHDTLKIAAHSLLDVVKSHADVIIDVTAADELATSWSTTDVFDVAISLQMRCIDLTRHVVILTGKILFIFV